MRNSPLVFAGATMVVEGVVLAIYGRRYVDFMARNGLADLTKRLLRKIDLQSPAVFAAIGIGEAIVGAVMVRRALAERRSMESAAASA